MRIEKKNSLAEVCRRIVIRGGPEPGQKTVGKIDGRMLILSELGGSSSRVHHTDENGVVRKREHVLRVMRLVCRVGGDRAAVSV